VKKVFIKENFGVGDGPDFNDVAILQLQEEVELSHKIGVACLPSRLNDSF
jgi:hypothetical protein